MPDYGTGAGGPDIISIGRDPDRPARCRVRQIPRRWRLLAAAALALSGGGIAAGLTTEGSGGHPGPAAVRPQRAQLPAIAPMLPGGPVRPKALPAARLVLGGDRLRLLSAPRLALTALGWADRLLGSAAPDPIGVRQIAQVTGGFVVLLAGGTPTGPAVGDVFLIPVADGAARAPRFLARANYLAVAPDHRDIWVEQAGPPAGQGPARSPTWLVDESSRRISPVFDLYQQHLLSATARGLLTQGASGEGAELISTVTGAPLRLALPGDALVVGAGVGDVAWQPPSCPVACPLHITSLHDGRSTLIALPPASAPDSYADPNVFDQAGEHIALVLDTLNRQHYPTSSHVYVADIGRRRLIRLPGGPIPLSMAPLGSGDPAGNPLVVSIRWTAGGSGLWIVASDGVNFQAAYWPGTGPLRVLPAQAGAVYMFALAPG